MTRLRSVWTRLRGIDARIADAALALGVTVAMIAAVAGASDPVATAPPGEPSAPVLLAMSAALAFRRRWPLGVLAVVFACMLVAGQRDGGMAEVIAIVIATYSAALHARRRVATGLTVLAMATVASALGAELPVPDWTLAFLILGPVWLAGSALRRRELRADALADRATHLERERDAALHAERARIARELHDVVTHGVSVMVMQAGAARQQLARDPDRSDALMHAVEDGGRQALDELRRFLGLLADDDAAAPLAPQPGLDQVEALVRRVRAAGVPVELAIEGRSRSLPSGIDLAAYRVVQEGLTNALKHGKHPHTRVLIRYAPRALELEIVDDGPASPEPAGRGLLGMRERVTLYGGTLFAGPEADHGYAVRARLPLP